MLQSCALKLEQLLFQDSENTIHIAEKNVTSFKRAGLFTEMKQKKKFKMADLKIQNGRLKKTSFSSSANSQYFFMKFPWIGPWDSRIN